MNKKDFIRIINEEISDFDFLNNQQYQKDRENNEYMQCENNEYEQFDEEEHWDNNMYYDVLKELFW